jgi:hypothetical protein
LQPEQGCLLRQNVFPDLNVQYEQIISPLQRRNEGRHIVLVGRFLFLILFVLKQPCHENDPKIHLLDLDMQGI